MNKVNSFMSKLKEININHIPRGDNIKSNNLTNLARKNAPVHHKYIFSKLCKHPTFLKSKYVL